MSVCPTVTDSLGTTDTHSQGGGQLERQGLHKMFRLNPIPPSAPAPTPADMDFSLCTMASQKLIQAYAAIPDTLYSMFPPLQVTTTRHQLASEWDDDCLLDPPSTTNTSHRHLLTIATKLGPGFPRVVLAAKQCIRRLKGVYRSRMCDPHNPLFPKLIEVCNLL